MPTKTASFLVAPNLYLVHQSLGAAKADAKPVEVATNHIVVVDVSGSMYGEIPKIRTDLKLKLPKLIGEKDTLSLIAFSGRNQCWTILEGEPVATLKDLSTVHTAIDRWLTAQCLTGFKDPLVEATKLIDRVTKKRPGTVCSLFFMSDGCDNQWPRQEVLKAVEDAAKGLAAATFVEYGFYADRPLLTAMAERAGGTLIFADTFDKYQPQFEAAMQKRPMGGKRIEVPVQGDPIGGFVWSQGGGELTTYGLTAGKASVADGTGSIWYLSPSVVGQLEAEFKIPSVESVGQQATAAAYAAISLYSARMKPEVVLPFLRATGDVAFIERFGGLFGKQKYTDFMEEAKTAAFDATKRLTKGCDPSKLPRDDAFTVLDVLNLLANDEDNRVLLDHEAFKYNRIGRGRVDANTVLTTEEQAEVNALTLDLAKAGKDIAKVKEITTKIASITNKPEPLKFVADVAPDGYPVSSLTYNEQNPNVSFLVRKTGKVDISGAKPAALKSILPDQFQTFIFRNYAVIKDGLVNIETLPVKLSTATLERLFAEAKAGRLPDDAVIIKGGVTLLNFKVLPVINRQQVRAASAKALFENEWALTKVQAAQKVYKSVLKEKGGAKKSAGFEETYGVDAATWLKDQGFTDYSGFGPKVVQAPATDFYMAKEMNVKLASFSAIPSLNEFKKQAAKGKLTPSAQLMDGAWKAVEAFLATDDGKDDKKVEAWLKAQDKALDATRRGYIAAKAQQVFGIIVGQIWFADFATPDENTMTLTIDGVKLACTVEMKEVEVKI